MSRNKFFIVLGILLICTAAYAATKITEMTEDTAPTADDLLMTINDPSGTPANRKATIANVAKGMTSTDLIDTADLLYETELDTESELETQITDMGNIIQVTEIDTLSELNAILTDATLITSLAGGLNITLTGTSIAVDNPVVADLTGNADTATALAANGSNCSAGSAPLGVDASGAAESCTDYEEDLANEAGLETAVGGVNVLIETEIDASSELAAIMDDETGSGLLVFGTSPTLATPTITGTASMVGVNVSGTLHVPTLKLVGLDCTGNSNGGALTADANGDVSCSDDDGGAGGGDNVTVNSSAADTTANFLDGDIDFTLVDGGAGGPDDITATVECTGCVNTTDILDDTVGLVDVAHTITLAGDPALAAGQCHPGASGIICEGSSADTIETLLTFTNPTSTDKTITFPNATGDVAVTASTGLIARTGAGAHSNRTITSGSGGQFTITNGGGTSGDPTISFNTSTALSGDHSLAANGGRLGSSGMIFEGATADTIELYVAIPDPVSTDKTVTLPNATTTLIGKDTTDTLTNKTYDTAGTGNSFSINGVAATANTGTGSVVRATSPTVSNLTNTGTITTAGLNVTGTLNIPNATTLPTLCEPGDFYQDTNATSGQQLYACESGSFVQQGGGSEVDTLDTVADRGATTDQEITTGGLVVSSDDTVGLGAGKGLIEFEDEGTDNINLMNANVGIGTTASANDLHVVGSTLIDGDADEVTFKVQAHTTMSTTGTTFQVVDGAGAKLLESNVSGELLTTGTIFTTTTGTSGITMMDSNSNCWFFGVNTSGVMLTTGQSADCPVPQ